MIRVLRVDDRLLHGQVAVAWTNFYKADVILIANNELLKDNTMQIAFKLATPAGVTLSMKSLDGAVAVINNPKHASRTIMVVTKTTQDAEYLIRKTGDAVKEVLLGGLRSGEGKKQIDMNSYMGQDDIDAMNNIAEKGITVIMQADPTSKKLSVDDIRRNYNK
jgi:PTS system mannose-specific IIB component/fructoselysine and glucoselysine-specific PTS system IIB component